jgi:hypothetical protein
MKLDVYASRERQRVPPERGFAAREADKHKRTADEAGAKPAPFSVGAQTPFAKRGPWGNQGFPHA